VKPVSMALFDFLQFEALLVGEIHSHFPMRFRHDLMDAPACVSSYLFQLGGRLIDDRRYFGDLFRRQLELRAKPFLHSNRYPFGMMKFKEKTPSVQSPKESAGDSPGDEHEDKAANQFPLQRAVHLKNSSWIAESAMANSFVKGSPTLSRLCLASRTAATVDMTITAADSNATRRSSGVKPFAFAPFARQSATTRASKPNGIAGGTSSGVSAADRSNRSIF
jgi:hypothetical protein